MGELELLCDPEFFSLTPPENPNVTVYLRQFHFHSPSEHTLEGKYFDMETHFVFNEGENYAVLGVFMVVRKQHPTDVVYSHLMSCHGIEGYMQG